MVDIAALYRSPMAARVIDMPGRNLTTIQRSRCSEAIPTVLRTMPCSLTLYLVIMTVV